MRELGAGVAQRELRQKRANESDEGAASGLAWRVWFYFRGNTTKRADHRERTIEMAKSDYDKCDIKDGNEHHPLPFPGAR